MRRHLAHHMSHVSASPTPHRTSCLAPPPPLTRSSTPYQHLISTSHINMSYQHVDMNMSYQHVHIHQQSNTATHVLRDTRRVLRRHPHNTPTPRQHTDTKTTHHTTHPSSCETPTQYTTPHTQRQRDTRARRTARETPCTTPSSRWVMMRHRHRHPRHSD